MEQHVQSQRRRAFSAPIQGDERERDEPDSRCGLPAFKTNNVVEMPTGTQG